MEVEEEFYGVSPRYHPPGFVPYSSKKKFNISTAEGNLSSDQNKSFSGKSIKSLRKKLNKTWNGNQKPKIELHHHTHKYTNCNCCPMFHSTSQVPNGGRHCDACDKLFGKKKGKNSQDSNLSHCICNRRIECKCRYLAREKRQQIDGFDIEPVEYVFARSQVPSSSISFNSIANPSSRKRSLEEEKNSPSTQRYMFEDLMRGIQWDQWKAQMSDPVLENVKMKMMKQNGIDRDKLTNRKKEDYEEKENKVGGKVYWTYIDYLTKDAPIRNTNTFKSPQFE